MSEPWVLAIDFGTSYTVAAARRDGRPAEVIEIEGERRVPSVIVIDASGQIVVGRAAESMAASYPDRVLRTPKYRLGIPTAVVLGGRPYAINDLVAALLAYVYREAVRYVGHPPSDVRLTYPASWSAPRREELLTAATRAGLPNPVLVPEPVAAAISYADDVAVAPGAHVLVYDLGGGTFDTAALRADQPGFVVVGRPAGDANLGGELFDELVANHMGERLEPAVWEKLQVSDEMLWQLAAASLRSEARRAKEVLSSHPEADVLLGLPTGIVNQRMYKAELDELIRPYIQESIDVMVRCAIDAGLRNEDLQAVYLVGGASRSPIVHDMVGQVFPQVQVSRRGDPKAVVALGATHPGIDITRLERRATEPGHTTRDVPAVPPPAPAAPAAAAAAPPTVTAPTAATTTAPPAPAAATVVGAAPTVIPVPSPPPQAPPAPPGAAPPAPPAPRPSAPLATPVPPVASRPPSAGNDRKKIAVLIAAVVGIVALVAVFALTRGGGEGTAGGSSTTVDNRPSSSTGSTAPSTTAPSTSGPPTTAPTTAPSTTAPLGPPPQLVVNLTDNQQVFLEDIDPKVGFAITGKTDIGATVTVNGIAAVVNADGTWQLFSNLASGDNPLTIVARKTNSAPAETKLNLRGAVRPTTTTTTTTLPSVIAVNDGFTIAFQGDGVPVSAGNVLANDGGQPVLQGFTQPGRGSVSVAPNGAVTYTPSGNGLYTTVFQYTVCSAANPGSCRTASVTINLLCNRNYPGGTSCG